MSVSRYLEISFGLRGPSHQAFTSFERVGFIARRPGAVGIFGNDGRLWAPALPPDPPKKGLVPHLPVRWGEQQIPLASAVSCRGNKISSFRISIRQASVLVLTHYYQIKRLFHPFRGC